MDEPVQFNLGDDVAVISIITFFLGYLNIGLYSWLLLRNLAIVTRVYSTLHAASSVILALLYLWTYSPVLYSILVWNSLGYCLYDTTVITVKFKALHVEPMMIVHHLAFILGLSYFYASYPYYVAVGLLMETSSIFLNWSWYLYKTGQTQTVAFKYAVGALITSYIYCRILLLLYIIYQSIYDLQCTSCVLFAAGLLVMNIYWFNKLITKANEKGPPKD